MQGQLRVALWGVTMRSSEAVRHIQQVASMGLAPHVAIPVMMDTLNRLVPGNPNPFFWAKPDGTITDFHIDEIRPQTMESSMMLGRHNTPDDMPTFDRLISGPRPVNNTGLLRQMAGWSRSAFYNDMLRGNYAENSVDFQIRDASGVRGMFALTRGVRDRQVNSAEIRRTAALVPHFLHAMDAPAQIDLQGARASDQLSHIIIDGQGAIESLSADAATMILQLHNMPFGSGSPLNEFAGRLPPVVQMVLERLRLIRTEQDTPPASIDVPTRWGLFRVRAVPMRSAVDAVSGSASDRTIVTIQPLVERRVRHVQKLRDTELTPAERRVALRMAGGEDGASIASELGMETSSYRQYAKRIYATLGVDGRMGVQAMLDS